MCDIFVSSAIQTKNDLKSAIDDVANRIDCVCVWWHLTRNLLWSYRFFVYFVLHRSTQILTEPQCKLHLFIYWSQYKYTNEMHTVS